MSKTCAICYWHTSHGVQQDILTLKKPLEDAGYTIKLLPTKDRRDKVERICKHASQALRFIFPYDLQIHLEQIHPEQFRLSKKNLILPNPEFMDPNVLRKCKNLTAILCKTKSAKALLDPWHSNCIYTGFKSEDRHIEEVQANYDKYFLLEGLGDYRGSQRLVKLWNTHPEWPKLTVVRNPRNAVGALRWKHRVTSNNILIIEEYLPIEELRGMQNSYGTHLLLSEVEGFGHSLNEAQSCKAVVFTTDAPPMNELISEKIGILIPYSKTKKQFMEKRYFFNTHEFEKKFEEYLKTSTEDKVKKGQSARESFHQCNALFNNAFHKLVHSLDN